MAAGDYQITIDKGATWPDYDEEGEPFFTVTDENGTPVDLTGWSATLVAITKPNGTPFINLSTSNGGIALGGMAGTIDPTLSATATSAIVPNNGTYKLNLISPGGSVWPLLRGTVVCNP